MDVFDDDSWHFVHSLAVLYASDGNMHNYNLLRRAQESTDVVDVARLPEIDESGFVDLVCDHPVCKEVCRICCPNEARMPLRPLPITWREPAGKWLLLNRLMLVRKRRKGKVEL